jgi:catechol-2,3-dioxygenase
MAKKTYNRRKGDVGNILAMEHVNVTVPDQALATFFYVNTLGLTRDPYIDWGTYNVWINAGRQQFHLPTAPAQVLRGHTALVVPDLGTLRERLTRSQSRLAETEYSFSERRDSIEVTCPWGNRIRCFAPGQFPQMYLGIPYVEFNVPEGTAPGIGRFYQQVMGCPAKVTRKSAVISIGQHQSLRFVETRRELTAYDGHHIAVYVSNFSAPHELLRNAGLITQESDDHQYRFQTLFDPENGDSLFEIEHEVRSLFHPMWERQLINRNPEQSFFNYQRDRDTFVPGG